MNKQAAEVFLLPASGVERLAITSAAGHEQTFQACTEKTCV